MTCIVGVVDGRKVWIGGDSAGCGFNTVVLRADPKVFRVGRLVVGYTTSFRMGQLLQHSLRVPTHPKGMDDHRWLVTRLMDSVRRCLKAGGWMKQTNMVEEGGNFLIGYKGGIFEVDSDGQVAIPAQGYASCGSGQAFALGALHAASELAIAPKEAMMLALAAAAAHNPFVRPPFHVLHT